MKKLLQQIFKIKIVQVRNTENYKIEIAEYYQLFGIVLKINYRNI